jgi:hypothetical protein
MYTPPEIKALGREIAHLPTSTKRHDGHWRIIAPAPVSEPSSLQGIDLDLDGVEIHPNGRAITIKDYRNVAAVLATLRLAGVKTYGTIWRLYYSTC